MIGTLASKFVHDVLIYVKTFSRCLEKKMVLFFQYNFRSFNYK